MLKCSNLQMVKYSNVKKFNYLNVNFQMFKCKMSIRLNFCRIVPQEFLQSFLSLKEIFPRKQPWKSKSSLSLDSPAIWESLWEWPHPEQFWSGWVSRWTIFQIVNLLRLERNYSMHIWCAVHFGVNTILWQKKVWHRFFHTLIFFSYIYLCMLYL